MDWDSIDWAALERLRCRFLEGSAGHQDYWSDEGTLASYDLTFAQRIGWKWDYVLGQLRRRGWQPPAGPVLDWGCGTGIAGRNFLQQFGAWPEARLLLADRSERAATFARDKARARFPGVTAEIFRVDALECQTLLLSHVLTELSDAQLETLLLLAQRATSILWVEPGTHEASRRLSQVRDRLTGRFSVVAPCTHQQGCPLLAPGNEPHWCHHFATPPSFVFTDANWARFGAMAGVDLRSLPLSFVVLDRRPVRPLPPSAVRVIGRPRLYKAHALLLGCGQEGLCEKRLTKRRLPDQFRAWKKERSDSLQTWVFEEDELVVARELELDSEEGPDRSARA